MFPMEYSDAEVSIITKTGSYVIQSASMKSESFIDFIRGYNYADDYNGVKVLEQQLLDTDSGLLEYKNSRGEDCVWYYSTFGDDTGLDILGYIWSDSLDPANNNLLIVFIICGILFLLMVIDGWYLLEMNSRLLRESAKLAEQASAAKTQFLSSMSHDIRTPMNAVLGMTDIARRNVEDPTFVAECLDKVTTAGNHLLTLINDVLDISKVESGQMRLNPSSISLERSISSTEDMIRPQLFEKRLNFKGDYSEIQHKYIVADELRLNQILINLLTNSVKYTRPGGSISFTVREEPAADSMNTLLVFVVEDNGIGMSADFQRNMYDSFSRATNSQINKIQGSGLGLAIVKKMVDLMNGSIECESEQGRGTRFTVKLEVPIAETPVEQQGSSDGSTGDISGMNVLVAEDNDINWEIIAAMLGEYGMICDRAENGKECADIIGAAPDGKYDIILMDIQMPVMNGREATKLIHQNERECVRNIPIVAMTADAFAEDVQACLDCGMDGHISKPVNIQKVLHYLNKIKDKKYRQEGNGQQ